MSSSPDKPGAPSTHPPLRLFNPSGYDLPVNRQVFQKILATVEKSEQVIFSLLEVVFVDENDITGINKEYLGQDYITDIISFRYDENEDNRGIEGTLYCCAPRIAEQSSDYNTDIDDEFCRIFIHGLLHLIGYEDKSGSGKKSMTLLEEKYLQER